MNKRVTVVPTGSLLGNGGSAGGVGGTSGGGLVGAGGMSGSSFCFLEIYLYFQNISFLKCILKYYS